MKHFILLFLLVTNVYSQVVLKGNHNPNARELIHKLNSTNDTLLLNSRFSIRKVTISNEKFRRVEYPHDTLVKMYISDLPEGRNQVFVYVNRKIIALNLIKR